MDDLPEGYTACPGDKAPSVRKWGDSVMVVLRCGVTSGPWPIRGTRWIHDGTAGDVIAIKRAE